MKLFSGLIATVCFIAFVFKNDVPFSLVNFLLYIGFAVGYFLLGSYDL